jgi:aminoglycoside phosphotransferase (APT) family kinase protein
MSKQQAEGYDIPAVEAWIAANVTGLTPPFVWTRLEGGHSNLTYQLEDAAGRLAVVRRPPQGELLPKAHDMSREWALISALGPTPVPVPRALGFCEDTQVTGAWFYLMGLIDGRPLYNSRQTADWVPPERREILAYSFIDTLAELHALEPDAIGPGTAPGPHQLKLPSTMTRARTACRLFFWRICPSRDRHGWCTATMVYITY